MTAHRLPSKQPGWTPLLVVQRAVALLCFVLAMLLFPNGRFVPTWTRVLGIIWTAYIGLCLFVPTLRLQSSLVWNSYGQVLVLVRALLWFSLIANPEKLTEAVTTLVQEALQPASVKFGCAERHPQLVGLQKG